MLVTLSGELIASTTAEETQETINIGAVSPGHDFSGRYILVDAKMTQRIIYQLGKNSTKYTYY